MADTPAKRSEERGESAPSRPMISEVNWVLLGLVIEQPGYGAQLKRRFERDFADVLRIGSESHVYTALNELQRRGMIEELSGPDASRFGTRRQPKVCYGPTEQGKSDFLEWLDNLMTEDRRQARMFARLLPVLAPHMPQEALTILMRLKASYLKEGASTSDNALQRLADRLVNEESRRAPEGRLPWVEYARQEFENCLDGADP